FDNDKNYGKGYIRRMITMGTPHLGSDLATFLFVERYNNLFCAEAVAALVAIKKGPVSEGAVDDLTPGSSALNAMRKTPFPGHAIAGNTSPDDSDYWFDMDSALYSIRIGTASPSGYCDFKPYDITSPEALVNSVFFDQPNDRVVQLASQRGGLPDANFTVCNG